MSTRDLSRLADGDMVASRGEVGGAEFWNLDPHPTPEDGRRPLPVRRGEKRLKSGVCLCAAI